MNADIIDRIRKDFPAVEAEEILTGIEAETKKKGYEPSPRILRCLLFLSKGSLEEFRRWKQVAEEDYRDAIMAAEYDSFKIQLRDFNQPFGSETVPNPLEAEWRRNQPNQSPQPIRASGPLG